MPSVAASLTLFAWIALAPRAPGGTTPKASGATNRDASITQIKALDEAARFEEKRAQGRCSGPPQIDRVAAAAAERAAHIHLTRMYLARDEAGVPIKDLVPLALQVARDLQLAYACDPAAQRYLDVGKRVLEELRAQVPEDDVQNRETLQREVVVINGILEQLKVQEPSPAAASVTPPTAAPKPEISAKADGPVRASSPPRPRERLSRLSLRLEGGYGLANLDSNPGHKGRAHRGGYFRLQVLARFNVGERRRVLLLFGPYYDIVNATDTVGYVGDALMQDAGAHLELQWTPLSWLDPWLSLNPFLEFGVGHNRIRRDAAISGIQVGGGFQACVWHSAVCPGVRLMTVPTMEDKNRPAVQVGLALDLMRLVGIALTGGGSKAATSNAR